MAPLILAVLWVIPVSCMRICPGLSQDQHRGGVSFQTKMRLKLCTLKNKKILLECKYSKSRSHYKIFIVLQSHPPWSLFISKWCFYHRETSCTWFLSVRSLSSFLEVPKLIFLGRKGKDGDTWFLFIHTIHLRSLIFVIHLWARLLLYENWSWNMGQE